jgi:hypothetical protein
VCTVGSKKVKSLLASRVWLEIASAIKEERLRQVAPKELLALFLKAYLNAISHLNEAIGVGIAVKDLFREVAAVVESERLSPALPRQRRVRYTYEYFKRDLSRLVTASEFTSDRFKMQLLPTSFAKEGVPVFIGEGVKIIGRVVFVELSR